MFRRRREVVDDDGLDDAAADDAAADDGAADDGAVGPGAAGEGADLDPVPGRPAGPWDINDEFDAALARFDFGPIRIPTPDGIEVRMELDPASQQVLAVTFVDGRSMLQVSVFAAPKSAGIWADVRAEIAESLRGSGGAAEEVTGPFGVELRGRAPAPGSGGQAVRFLGVDGPRWFLRGLLTGVAATDPGQARRLEDAFRGIVVDRGGEAMAPRDPIPLVLPRDAKAALGLAEAPEAARPGIDPFRRGPEITETR
ncbi:MAG TPA: DUF3710 domain-containing protein [Mycobacteriales bacterium]|nr:DUF3710 domain-containing protein [Mycobacteriales bacterium]